MKVGRPALDEAARRLIEEQNPDIAFDWPRILEAQPVAPSGDDSRNRRVRRDRPRPPAAGTRRPARSTSTERPGPPAAELKLPEVEDATENLEIAVAVDAGDIEVVDPDLFEPDATESDVEEAIEQLTDPDVEEKGSLPATRTDQSLGDEQLTRFRARYAELLARITERGGDPARVDALRAEAQALNPDTWVSPEDIQQGIQLFEPKIRDLRAALGLRRRRRSRRGGRRRRGEGQAAPPPPTPESGGE